VAIRITERREGPSAVLQVDGWLVENDVGELVRAVEAPDAPVILDFSELRSADRASLGVLRGLSLRGVEFTKMSRSIEIQLDLRTGTDTSE